MNRNDGLVVVGHGDEAEAFTLVRLQVLDHFHALNGAERTEQLPQDILLGLGREIVHKNAPTWSIDGIGWEHRVAQVAGQRRVSEPAANVVNRAGREAS